MRYGVSLANITRDEFGQSFVLHTNRTVLPHSSGTSVATIAPLKWKLCSAAPTWSFRSPFQASRREIIFALSTYPRTPGRSGSPLPCRARPPPARSARHLSRAYSTRRARSLYATSTRGSGSTAPLLSHSPRFTA